MIYNTLLPAVERQRRVSDRQYGFQKARTTIDTIELVIGLAEDIVQEKAVLHCSYPRREEFIQFTQLEPYTKVPGDDSYSHLSLFYC